MPETSGTFPYLQADMLVYQGSPDAGVYSTMGREQQPECQHVSQFLGPVSTAPYSG